MPSKTNSFVHAPHVSSIHEGTSLVVEYQPRGRILADGQRLALFRHYCRFLSRESEGRSIYKPATTLSGNTLFVADI